MNSRPVTGSRDVTNYLRGLAILAVVVTHYAYAAFDGIWEHYASATIALFFGLGGYGAAHSLAKYDALNVRSVLSYYWSRALRIYPLFWVAFALRAAMRGYRPSLRVMALLPTETAPATFWFLTFLVQAYLLAPFLYWLLAKLGRRRYIVGVAVAGIAVHIAATLLGVPYSRGFFVYRFTFLGHLLVFALGMAIPLSDTQPQARPVGRTMLWLALLLGFLVLSNYVRFEDMLFPSSQVYLAPLFMLYTAAFCWASLALRPCLFPLKLLSLLGRNSYAIYLFHTHYFVVLTSVGIVQNQSFESVLWTVLLAPLFVLLCVLLERASAAFVGLIGERVHPFRRGPAQG